MKSVAVKFTISVAKRSLSYEGKCKFLHGYGHVVEAEFSSDTKGDMVVDFYEIKEKLGKWLDENWDHNTLLNKGDKPLGNVIEDMTGQKIFYLEGDPTSENMAQYIKETVCPELFDDVTCTRVRIYDTANEFAEVEG